MIEDMMPLTEYIECFGGIPDIDELDTLTQAFIQTYHRFQTDPLDLVSGFGIDWLQLLLEHNIKKEEYEICSIFRDLIKDYMGYIANKPSIL